MFKANQLFSLETNALCNLMMNMGMFPYVIKLSSKTLLLSYPFVDICLQDWSTLFADIEYAWYLPLQSKKNWCFPTNNRCTNSSLLRTFPRGFSESVFYYITVLFSHPLSGPYFVLRKKHEFRCLVASRLKISISHQKLEEALPIKLKRIFVNWES